MTTGAEPTKSRRARKPSPAEGAPALLGEIVAPASLGEMVFDRLRDAIIDRSLPPGARVAEWVIAEQLGVSRTPVRETLWRLRQMGLIEAVGRKGYRVAYPSRTAIEQAYEVHEALQVLAVGLATERATAENLDAIREAARASLAGAENGSAAEFLRWDDEFHERITGGAQNPRLKVLVDDTAALVLTLRAPEFLYERAALECARQHVEIGDAMAHRNRVEAEGQMRGHIQRVRDYVLEGDSGRQNAVPEPAS